MGLTYQCDRSSWTPTATADGAQFAGANQYDGYLAGGAPDLACITEAFLQGEVSSSTVNVMAIRRHSTKATTPTAKTPAKANPSSQANVGTYQQTAATQPTVSNATHALNLSLNTYGGEVRWVAPYRGEIFLIGGSAGNEEASLSCVSGTPGALSTHQAVEEL